MKFLRSVVAVGALFVSACTTNSDTFDVDAVFSSSTEELRLEVDYMTGAEPYVGETPNGISVWGLLRSNLAALTANTKAVTVPEALSEMAEIPSQSKNYTTDDILALSELHRSSKNLEDGIATIYILFLDGFFINDGESDKTILGVSIGNTGIIAMFKPAITTNLADNEGLQTFTEQSVLIHESGHTLGLVNNGLALASSHQDTENGNHCTNEECVMYYLNEGGKDLLEFVRKVRTSSNVVIFGDECLADAVAALLR